MCYSLLLLLAIVFEIVYSMLKWKEVITLFDRVEYKSRAKDVLRGDYWSCFLVTLIFSLISGVGNGFLNIEVTLENMHTVYEQYAPVILAMLPYATVASIVGLLISLFVINVVHVGRA